MQQAFLRECRNMPFDVFLALVFCAFINALWNSLLKFKADAEVATTLLAIGGGVAATGVLFVTGTPGLASLPYILCSIVIHLFYWTLLGKTYAIGELSLVYPVARGLAPVATTGLGVILLNEMPQPIVWVGTATVVSGIVVIALLGTTQNIRFDRRAIGFAAMTAACITSYSLVDGMGARQSSSGFAYTAFLYVCNGWVMLAYGLLRQREKLIAAVDGNWYIGMFNGSMSLLSYSVGVWAMTKAPIGMVAALRETSILFAVLLGVLLLREPPRLGRILGALIVCSGVMIIKSA
jgi:drug/metabolite transporter (DMT)-like permease